MIHALQSLSDWGESGQQTRWSKASEGRSTGEGSRDRYLGSELVRPGRLWVESRTPGLGDRKHSRSPAYCESWGEMARSGSDVEKPWSQDAHAGLGPRTENVGPS